MTRHGTGMALGVALGLIWAGLAGEADGQRDCSVSRLNGTSIQMRAGDGLWRSLAGAALPGGTTSLRTGPGTQVEVTCTDGVVVTLGVESTLELVALTGLSGDTTPVSLRLWRGIVGLVAPTRTWSAFEVTTPLAIASVRSTEWLVESDGPLGSAVFVRKGAVAVTRVTDPAQTVTLAAGDGITLLEDGTDDGVHPWKPPRIARSGARLGFGWQ